MTTINRHAVADAIGKAIWGPQWETAGVAMTDEACRLADAAIAALKTDDGAAPPGRASDGVASGHAAPSSPPDAAPRRFQLYRHNDLSGVSGTGVVAWGIAFPDGAVALRWPGEHPSTVAWGCLADVVVIHGHSGATEVRWLDHDPIDMWWPADGPEGGDSCDTDD